ncbi:hypothetical protein V8J88_24555 [Massilia sp. W12]|uniref:methylation-associated defense system restriction endonuclease subunit S MAD5 n=1 Tax=Massilia sp. W12 TaxID=3126507 RepID=UPI0030D0FBDF
MTFMSFKNARIVRSGWLDEGGRRLDCNPYMSGALEARDTLQKLKARKDALCTLTSGYSGGIYNGPVFARAWVDDPRFGVPFLSNSEMLSADLTTLPLLQRRYAESKKLAHLKLMRGTTLITCSGTIGRMTLVRPDMEGMWSSQHIMKVVPDPERVPPGYLYAFLSSRYGVPLVVSGTYGAIIQHIEPKHIEGLPVPRLSPSLEAEVHALIVEAADRRAAAAADLKRAQSLLLDAIGQPSGPPGNNSVQARQTRIVALSDIQRSMRMEGNFYNPTATHVEKWARSSPNCIELGVVADVYDVPPFKHIYVDEGHGIPFFTSGELFDIDRVANKFLAKGRTVNLHKYVLQRDWVLLARSGQLGGIIGRPQYADSALDGAATSDHVIRLVPKGIPGGYLFAYLYSSSIGYPLLTRCATGHSIPALWPSQLNSLPVVLAAPEVMKTISRVVVDAFENRVQATALEHKARQVLEQAIEKMGG